MQEAVDLNKKPNLAWHMHSCEQHKATCSLFGKGTKSHRFLSCSFFDLSREAGWKIYFPLFPLCVSCSQVNLSLSLLLTTDKGKRVIFKSFGGGLKAKGKGASLFSLWHNNKATQGWGVWQGRQRVRPFLLSLLSFYQGKLHQKVSLIYFVKPLVLSNSRICSNLQEKIFEVKLLHIKPRACSHQKLPQLYKERSSPKDSKIQVYQI